jgi:hypothetical protein
MSPFTISFMPRPLSSHPPSTFILLLLSRWSADSPGYLVFRALLLTSGPSTLSRLVSRLCAALQPLLVDQQGDAALRLSALQLLDSVLEDQDRCGSTHCYLLNVGCHACIDVGARMLGCEDAVRTSETETILSVVASECLSDVYVTT